MWRVRSSLRWSANRRPGRMTAQASSGVARRTMVDPALGAFTAGRTQLIVRQVLRPGGTDVTTETNPEAQPRDVRHLLSIPWSPGGHRRVAHWDRAGTMPVPGQGPTGEARLRPSWSWKGCHGEPDCGGSPQGAGTPRPHRTSGSAGWGCRAGRNEQLVGDQHRGAP